MPFTDETSRICRADFPALSRTLDGQPFTYLDGPAGTQVPRAVIDAISGFYTSCNANTHGEFITSREADAVRAAARRAAAAFLGAPAPETISFGQNMTTLCYSLSHALSRELRPGDEVVITELDHEANRGPWLRLQDQGVTVQQVRLLRSGTLDEEDLRRKITGRTRIVAIGLASNALGTVNDVPLARRLSRDVGAWLVVDAVHSAAHLPVDVQQLDVDFLLCSAYKFYGPHVGLLYCRPGLLDRLEPDRLRTQEQQAPHRIETGTLNAAALAGVTAAIEYIAALGQGGSLREKVVSAMSDIAAYEHSLARHYYENVSKFPGVTAWGPDFTVPQRAPTVSVSFDGLTAQEAARHLGEQGIFTWHGHYYAVRAMEVLGLGEDGALRVGVMLYNTREEIDRLLEAISRLGVP